MQYLWHNLRESGDSAYPKACYGHKKTKHNKEVHKEEEVFQDSISLKPNSRCNC
jgi:hypothetical protein